MARIIKVVKEKELEVYHDKCGALIGYSEHEVADEDFYVDEINLPHVTLPQGTWIRQIVSGITCPYCGGFVCIEEK